MALVGTVREFGPRFHCRLHVTLEGRVVEQLVLHDGPTEGSAPIGERVALALIGSGVCGIGDDRQAVGCAQCIQIRRVQEAKEYCRESGWRRTSEMDRLGS